MASLCVRHKPEFLVFMKPCNCKNESHNFTWSHHVIFKCLRLAQDLTCVIIPRWEGGSAPPPRLWCCGHFKRNAQTMIQRKQVVNVSRTNSSFHPQQQSLNCTQLLRAEMDSVSWASGKHFETDAWSNILNTLWYFIWKHCSLCIPQLEYNQEWRDGGIDI